MKVNKEFNPEKGEYNLNERVVSIKQELQQRQTRLQQAQQVVQIETQNILLLQGSLMELEKIIESRKKESE